VDEVAFAIDTKEKREELRRMAALMLQSVDATDKVQFAEFSARLIPQLLDALAAAEDVDHGNFGAEIRDAVRHEFLKQWDGQTLLAQNVSVVSFMISMIPGRKIVDVRLEVGGQ
jgi:hypothetical protein